MPQETYKIAQTLLTRFGKEDVHFQRPCCDDVETIWLKPEMIFDIMDFLKNDLSEPYNLLYDLCAIDERSRELTNDEPPRDFTIVYHLYSFDRNKLIRLKVPLQGTYPSLTSITRIWPSANWYEREIWDMFGIHFDRHPMLKRILMPRYWTGHPLRKESPARATEFAPYELHGIREETEEAALMFKPEEWGMERETEDTEFMFLNLGPQHPGTHGILRTILQLKGEEIIDAVLDIGFHHRGVEKMGERQTWHTFIPYTDRLDYLAGVLNTFPYVLAVEKLAGITVPDRAQMIRILIAELYRISSHLVWYGTFAQDLGAMSPVFYMFNDRERVLSIIEAICGARMHPNWFRIGGVAQDLPNGWEKLVSDFLSYLPKQMKDYEKLLLHNLIFKARTVGIGAYTAEEAIDWGVTGPGLRACGVEWDFRKKAPYSGYDQLEFEVPTAENGDCYDRALVRVEEIRQSLRIIEQCLKHMPPGAIKADHPLTTPPRKEKTMLDIETLIHHFLSVSWGPVIPPGEAMVGVESSKGNMGFYLVSSGGTSPYRLRIRTPSFAHLQMLPSFCKGLTVSDLLAILGSIDYVLGDVDR